MRLYHFTTEADARRIRETGVIKTHLHHVLGEHFAWFTDAPAPSGASLGLKRRRVGRSFMTADRMAERIEVDVPHPERWTNVRVYFTPQILAMLEAAPGVNPDIWWVSRTPVALLPQSAEPDPNDG